MDEPRDQGGQTGTGPAAGNTGSPLATAASIALVAVVAVGIFLGGFFTHAAIDSDDGGEVFQVQAGPTAAAVEPTAQPAVEATVDDDPGQGPEDAAVTIIEFSDYQCPACGNFHSTTFPLLMENFGDRIRFVYRDFPLASSHPQALKAAEASECADDQDAFWEYHDLLFQNQSALDVDSLKGYAASLGLETTTFDECLDSGKHTGEVAKDFQDGQAAGVNATPYFFINGSPIRGSPPYASLEPLLEALLAQADE